MKNILIKANQNALKKGANSGWVFPSNLPYPVYKEQVLGSSPSELDEYLTTFFMSDFEANVKQPILQYEEDIPEYVLSLLEGCFFVFENGYYQVCIPALFSVLEALLVDLSNQGKRKNIRYKQGLDELQDGKGIYP